MRTRGERESGRVRTLEVDSGCCTRTTAAMERVEMKDAHTPKACPPMDGMVQEIAGRLVHIYRRDSVIKQPWNSWETPSG